MSCRCDRLANEGAGSVQLNCNAKRVERVTTGHATVAEINGKVKEAGKDDVRVTWRTVRKRQLPFGNPEEAQCDVIDSMIVRQSECKF